MTYCKNQYLSIEEQKINAEYIMTYLLNNGWSKNAICGMLGNMQTESTINPCIWQNLDSGNQSLGYGLVQWTPSTKYTSWATSNGYSIGDINGQLDRLQYEIDNDLQWISTTSYPLSFHDFKFSNETPEYLAQAFLINYERPNNQNQPNRSTQARFWFDYFEGIDVNTGSIVDLVNWFKDRIGIPTYSMDLVLRLGPDYYDCSSAVYTALIYANFIPDDSFIGNTDTLYTLLSDIGIQISRSEVKYGDIFISLPTNDVGHTGVFLNNNEIIHMNATDDTISETIADGRMGNQPIYYFRLYGGSNPIIPDSGNHSTLIQLYLCGAVTNWFN